MRAIFVIRAKQHEREHKTFIPTVSATVCGAKLSVHLEPRVLNMRLCEIQMLAQLVPMHFSILKNCVGIIR